MLWVLTARDTLTAPLGLVRPMTRKHVGLLGPCFKMGRVDHRPTRRRRTALPQKRGAPRAGTGFQHVCSGYSPPVMGSACPEPAFQRDWPSACLELVFTLLAPLGLVLVITRTHVGLLCSCLKTGRVDHQLIRRKREPADKYEHNLQNKQI